VTPPDEPAGPPLDLDAIEADLDAIETHLAELDDQPADERPVAAQVADEQLAGAGADGA
jgi:hypothetical protein